MTKPSRGSVVLGSMLALTLGSFGCDSSSADETLEILVTNDDGVGAEGIDALVEALRADPRNEIVVSAPAEQRSGSGDATIETRPTCGTGQAMPSSTASGYDTAVWAVDGCPADAVLYALDNLYPNGPPDLVLSGINQGQNVGNVNGLLSQISGTVGAAKTAACADVPAVATSQGEGEVIDYPASVAAVLQWLDDHRAAVVAGQIPVQNITSINVPSCGEDEIRGTVEVPLATENPNGYLLPGPQDCTSAVEDVSTDVEAFFNGYIAVTPVPRNTTCPDQ